MRFTVFILFLFISSCSCNKESKENPSPKEDPNLSEISFDKKKWNIKKGHAYPYRERMLNNVIFNDSLRSLKRNELIETLGEPTRTNNEYVYYLIEESKALFVTLHASTLVIKFKEDDSVEWMKIHE